MNCQCSREELSSSLEAHTLYTSSDKVSDRARKASIQKKLHLWNYLVENIVYIQSSVLVQKTVHGLDFFNLVS